MEKGISTKLNILEIALKQVRKFGLEALSIGELAKTVGMSKSGLFAHFKSKESMQVMILDYAAENYVLKVVRPALKVEAGLPRLKGIIDCWIKWSAHNKYGGCPLIAAAIEFDDRPGKVRDSIRGHLNDLVKTIERSVLICKREGHFVNDSKEEQIAYEIYSLVLGFHIYQRLLGIKDAEQKLRDSLDELYSRYQT